MKIDENNVSIVHLEVEERREQLSAVVYEFLCWTKIFRKFSIICH